MTPSLTDWEDDLGRLLAHRLRTHAAERLGGGEWTGADFEDAIEAAERRMTGRQREILWQALTTDSALAEAAAHTARDEGSTLI